MTTLTPADDRLSLGIHTDIRRAICGDVAAGALVAELARLYLAAGEPLPGQLREYAPSGYWQTQRNEIIREDCNDG